MWVIELTFCYRRRLLRGGRLGCGGDTSVGIRSVGARLTRLENLDGRRDAVVIAEGRDVARVERTFRTGASGFDFEADFVGGRKGHKDVSGVRMRGNWGKGKVSSCNHE